jgi:hypothetical protein
MKEYKIRGTCNSYENIGNENKIFLGIPEDMRLLKA